MRSKHIGNAGEDLVMRVLAQRGLKRVERIGTPVKILGKKKDRMGYTWHKIIFGEKVAGDTHALAPGGRGVLIETKTIRDRNLRYSDLSAHQPEYLNDYVEAGGLALLVWVHQSGVYVMKWPIPEFRPRHGLTPEQARELDIEIFTDEYKPNEKYSCSVCGREISSLQKHDRKLCGRNHSYLKKLKPICYRDSRATMMVGDSWIFLEGKYRHVAGLTYPESLEHEFCDHEVK